MREIDLKRINVTLEQCDNLFKEGGFVALEQNQLIFGSDLYNENSIVYKID